ncbi:MAG: potA [Gammaproteobacteria bacterium]|jgi:spermidine/putrescine transport system ATP-binding protein|nr:potA [Gammaproteobacteria bacterium]
MSKNIIELHGISKSYDGQMILDDINLTVRDGEFLTLLGPSGCGKTTLLRMLAGLEKPSSGKILIDGRDAAGLDPQERHVNTVFQSYALFPHMTVFNNVAFGLRCDGVDEEAVKTRVTEMLRMVRLTGYENRKPAALSGGQQQRVAIARAVVKEPIVLLLDEPLSSLDYRLRKNMQIELKELQRKLGIAFVFVTHDQEEALSMSDTIVVLQQGKVVQQGTPREIYENPTDISVATFIGESNIFDLVIEEANESELKITVESISYTVRNPAHFKTGDKIHLLIRPEDTRVYHRSEIETTEGLFQATVTQVIYKGTTVDLILKLPDGKRLSATEFFDEDNGEDVTYTIGETVWISWPLGWEVVLPYET